MYITKRQLEELKKINEYITMKNARFNLTSPDMPSMSSLDDDTARIREATKTWREAWIIAPLNTIIDEIEKKQSSTLKI